MLETFNSHRQTIFGIAYRMLGRVSEAQDMVQEVWLRWQKQDEAAITSPKAWLVSTMTRLCIDQLRSARRAREDYYGIWLPEPLMASSTPGPDEAAELADSLTMAFMVMLESLEPLERAIFLLREVFSYDYPDIAAIVGKSEVNCRQIVSRAKAHLRAEKKAPPPPSEQAQRLVEQFLAAAETGEVKQLLALLAEDAVVYSDGGGKVRAAGRPIISSDHVSRFFIGIWPRLPADTEWHPALINERNGFLMRTKGEVYGACSFETEGDKIRNIYMVLNPEKLRHLDPGPN
ncbi:RNA polymerase sigma-70 factor [Luteolibacter luteus]|uniref:RNA polymerase sigma-70 factor n=1 Tax=Luteolibacter luteus TaxID=2728835 RepID=A0A858RNR9_9BACT|nr:RNA polymerase sigma-70 factor [Luteolibacter luteus]QJE98667.1 RNA polymerase sigma-70 factor [Luteolibacter luteus]